MTLRPEEVRFDERGLVPAVVQDARTREVLTLAYMNEESLRRTLAEGETWFWSRSRAELWRKGATSGNTQRVVGLRLDCDSDALVVLVEPRGPACHTGAASCFARDAAGEAAGGEAGAAGGGAGAAGVGEVLEELYAVVAGRRREMPAGSYTTYLFEKGLNKILKKVGEESAETIIAAKDGDPAALTAETADLVYHLVVLMVERGLTLGALAGELARRRGGEGRA
ncbi:MAG TPA: bifunctional phosphoribosyl-AMP cyclohydrolase/phosphoribosyl-ATP diphosphatase HisIE [Pyrinomonadaceae bacterium]|jgi:phosphoribosyl-ATP pyrophosphohydrolase/phosphoribosyl-AMP cyclohydrolase